MLQVAVSGLEVGHKGRGFVKAIQANRGFAKVGKDDRAERLHTRVGEKPHLVIPYTLDANDMKFSVAPGFTSGDGFYQYLKDAFDVLYREGKTAPKMMSIGLHTRLAGRPGRAAALERFLDYLLTFEDVWITRRVDIARHWIATHPAP